MNTAPAPDTTLTVGTMYFHWARHVDMDRRLCLCRVRPRTAVKVRTRHWRGGQGPAGEHCTRPRHGTSGLDDVLPLDTARRYGQKIVFMSRAPPHCTGDDDAALEGRKWHLR